MAITLEHANITVRDLDAALRFFLAAAPAWHLRGEGRMDWHGQPIRWLHVGDAQQYIALRDGGEGPPLDWRGTAVGVKHLGLLVDDLDTAIARLAEAGFVPDHSGSGAHRKAMYFNPDDLVQVELVQYLSDRPAERNRYD